MRRPPNPYRVLAHALDAGDLELARLLADRLLRPAGERLPPAARDAVQRLARALKLD